MDAAGLILGLVVAGASMWWEYRRRRGVVPEAVLRLADAQFRELLITEGPPELCFDGRSAEIVAEGRSYDPDHLDRVVSVTRYARNAYGEYFFFLCEGGPKPYFKHIEQRAAQAALGKRYLPPSTSV